MAIGTITTVAGSTGAVKAAVRVGTSRKLVAVVTFFDTLWKADGCIRHSGRKQNTHGNATQQRATVATMRSAMRDMRIFYPYQSGI